MNDSEVFSPSHVQRAESDRSPLPAPGMPASDGQNNEFNKDELLGAIDIVHAFTALRHELKLQVRDGRELREATIQGLTRVEQSMQSLSRAQTAIATQPQNSDHSSRRLAESIVEIEESLQRAVHAIDLAASKPHSPIAPQAVAIIRRQYESLPAVVRWFAGSYLKRTCVEIETALNSFNSHDAWTPATDGICLLLVRVHRLMSQNDLCRIDVAGLQFDSESMNAIELVQLGLCPSGYVAEQLRPAYLWRNAVLKTAEVRVEK